MFQSFGMSEGHHQVVKDRISRQQAEAEISRLLPRGEPLSVVMYRRGLQLTQRLEAWFARHLPSTAEPGLNFNTSIDP